MAAITPADLNNAKLDVDHIAALATSPAATVTDRLGNVKSTVKAAIDSLKAFNSRGAWVSAAVYAVKDLVSNGGLWYVCVEGHTAAGSFATDAAKWRLYQGVTTGELLSADGAALVNTASLGAGAVTRSVRDKLREHISVKDFGAVGDGVTYDTAAIQLAINAAGVGGEVLFPYTANGYKVSSLQLLNGQTLKGCGRENPGLVGDGTAPVILTNVHGSGSYPVRNVRLHGLRVQNTNHHAVRLHVSPDSSIQECLLQTTNAPALSSVLSVRCAINKNRMLSSGTTHAAEYLDNCNGTDASNNSVSGGQAGSGVVVGKTQTINLDNTVIEVAGGFGVSIAGDYVNGGNCSGVSLRGLYCEQVKRPLEVGLKYTVFGIDLTGMYIGNADLSVVAARDSALHIGRVEGMVLPAFYAAGSGTESLIEWYDVTNGAGPNPFLSGSNIVSKAVSGYANIFALNAGFAVTGRQNLIYGKNEIQINANTAIGEEREWISPTITANVAYGTSQCVEPTSGGGIITALDILDVKGSVNCTLQVGYSASISEVLNVDPSTLTYSAGYLRHLTEASNKTVRPTFGLQIRTQAGAGTGTFRVRIRYRV